LKTYARIQDGIVAEIIVPLLDDNGNPFPIEEMFVPAIVETLVDITNVSPQPEQRWLYAGKKFTPPS
jgi:hypothetical protein